MKTETTPKPAVFNVPADLDPTTVGAVHAALLEAVGQDGAAPVEVTLDGDSPPSVLTLQLLVSARKARAKTAVSFCERAQSSLALVGSKKEF
ncbi:hypothetical protein [Citreimonas sp.]|uniref:hypothetical protein n=1 Tax=Citreimonas sp. TaxID=3036715 RepID=UPI0035C7C781